MNTKRIKTQTLVLILLFVTIIFFIITSPFIYIYFENKKYDKTDSSTDYFNKNYVMYNGGKEAEIFFDEYVVNDEYIDISFKYRDNDNAIRLYDTSRTIFVLDVRYKTNVYDFLFKDIYNKTNRPDIADEGNYYGDFLMTNIIKNDSVYIDNYCGIFFNKKNNIIRYVFINDVNSVSVIKSHLTLEYINRSVDISWK